MLPAACCLGQGFKARLESQLGGGGGHLPGVRDLFSLQYSQVRPKVASDPEQGSRCRQSRQWARGFFTLTDKENEEVVPFFSHRKPEQRRQMGMPTALRNGTLFSLPEELVLRNGFFLTYLFCVCALIHVFRYVQISKKGTGANLVAHTFN